MYNNGNSSKNVTGASVVDGTLYTVDIADDAVTADKLANSVNTDIATGVSGSTTAGDALPKAGGAMTGAITTNSTFDGRDVATDGAALDALDLGIDSTATSTKLTISDTGIDTPGTITADGLQISAASGNLTTLLDCVNGASSLQFRTGAGANSTYIRSGTGGSSNMAFDTNGTERMRIDSSGNVEIGTAEATTGKLRLTGAFITNTGIDIETTQVSNGSKFASFRNSDGTQIGYISEATNSSVSYSTSSDYRLKENVVPMTGSIDRLKALKPSNFNFIADAATTVDGFLAHEAGAVVPEAVSGEKDAMTDIGNVTNTEGEIVQENIAEPTELEEGQTWAKTGEQADYQGIDQSKLVPLLVSALQEAITRIETLESA